ncbi:alpha-ketoglutarate-dependent dioxygenase AlkB [Flaviaesturariibacter flavus]|uniref:Alpha-ketoglutarate-dependent dioxygenase AlkB n=1 Tax=Flaviaesturariibacter flavus TaxID=2502780 RepID=A0A4R1BC65_9BACT|nr:alpha-ketoglutarate-dependent dioxygenase AlkB [Flaviaesturariibacter flavus]
MPQGFRYLPDFLSVEEEADLLRGVEGLDLHPFLFQGYTAKRLVASFGRDWHFDTRTLAPGRPVPPFLEPVAEKVAAHLGLRREDFAELLVTAYPPGAVINWHRDAPPFALIAGLSLGSDCTFRLRPQEKKLQTRGATRSLVVARRSLYIMEGAARSDWQHSTAPVAAWRWSVTLRTLYAK